MKRTVLITGVAGFIGRYVARIFRGQGWTVYGIDNAPPENAPLASLERYWSVQLPHSDLVGIIEQAKPTVCIHCAGRASVGLSLENPTADFYASTVLTFELLEQLRHHAPECRVLYLSSAAIYGNPTCLPVDEELPPAPLSPYGFHKRQSELLCQEYTRIWGLPTASVRIFSAYGPGLRRQVVWDICAKAITHKRLHLQGTGQESRDFIHAIDIARALLLLAESAPCRSEVYNLASGQEISIAQLSEMVLETLEERLPIEFDGQVPPGTPLNWLADIGRLKDLGFVPSVPFDAGVRAFVHWCRAELVGV